MYFQLRPDLVNPRALLDLRVRRAIAYAVDKQAISDAVYGGTKIQADTPVWSGSAWGAALDGSIATYPLDLATTDRLLGEAGYRKADGFYQGTDGRLTLVVATIDGPDFARELLVLADRMAAAGVEVQQRVVPAVQAQNAQVRSVFPALFINSSSMGDPGMHSLASAQFGTAANRWLGGNRGGWSSPEFDRLLTAFDTSLDHDERLNDIRGMLRLYSEDLPWISLFFTSLSTAYVTELSGVAPVVPETTVAWNIHEWEFDA
jgi:peptide/nickel transport system substrate-binding protein